jgi:tetratricopeptide (TPR) repeat protein
MIPLRIWLPIAFGVALAGGWGVVQAQRQVDAVLEPLQQEVDVLYLPSPEWVKRLSLGYDGLMGGIYWTRVVQYYGREHLKASEGGEPDYRLLDPLLDITTTLDPELLIAYRFGAIFLAEPMPGGPGQPEEAVKLLEKGIAHNPDYWRFWWDMGFVYYRYGEYQKSSEAFHRGAQHPKALPWMHTMAARVAAEGGDRKKARILWEETYHSTDDEAIRITALSHIAGLQADDDIEALEGIVKRYAGQSGELPRSWQEMVAAGRLRGVPLDPAGHPYRLLPDGRVVLSPASPVQHSTLGRRT